MCILSLSPIYLLDVFALSVHLIWDIRISTKVQCSFTKLFGNTHKDAYTFICCYMCFLVAQWNNIGSWWISSVNVYTHLLQVLTNKLFITHIENQFNKEERFCLGFGMHQELSCSFNSSWTSFPANRMAWFFWRQVCFQVRSRFSWTFCNLFVV